MEEQVVQHYHHSDQRPTVGVKVEHNSRGDNWEVSVQNCESVEQAIALAKAAISQLKQSLDGSHVDAS